MNGKTIFSIVCVLAAVAVYVTAQYTAGDVSTAAWLFIAALLSPAGIQLSVVAVKSANPSSSNTRRSGVVALCLLPLLFMGCATADQAQAQRANDQSASGVTVTVNPIGSASPTGAIDWNRTYEAADSADAKVALFNEMIEYAKAANIELDEDFQALYDSAENDAAKADVIKSMATAMTEASKQLVSGAVHISHTTVNVTVSNSGTSDQAATGGPQTPHNENPINLSADPSALKTQ